MKRFLAPLVLGTAVLLLVAGCGRGSNHNDQDISFARDMVPHHQQAVEMSDLAATRAADPAVKALAVRIKDAQDPEIRTMQGWLSDWGAATSGAGADAHGGGHGGHTGGAGMMSDADMTSLRSASGAEFDRMFLRMMIEHHKGAIEMAKAEQANGKFQPAKDLARTIDETQAKEIAEMEQLQARVAAS